MSTHKFMLRIPVSIKIDDSASNRSAAVEILVDGALTLQAVRDVCGTDAGYHAHIRSKTPTCEHCKAAHRETRALERAAKKKVPQSKPHSLARD